MCSPLCNFSTSELPKVCHWYLVQFHLKMFFSPQLRARFRHRNFKKWSDPDVFCTFSLENVLLATATCDFSRFGTSKSGPNLPCFVHFHLKMSFSPQQRAIFDFSSISPATSLAFGAGGSSFFWLSRYCIFVLLTLLHLICFSTLHIVGSLLFKLPSI